MTPCHGVRAALTPIYLLQQGQCIGRKEIGHIRTCPAEKCGKPYGEPVRYAGTGGFSDEEWQKMLKIRAQPPFYFVKTSGGLWPEDYRNIQDVAASGGTDKRTPETLPRYGLSGSEKAAGEAIEAPEWMNED